MANYLVDISLIEEKYRYGSKSLKRTQSHTPNHNGIEILRDGL